jgi:hypothetical protein
MRRIIVAVLLVATAVACSAPPPRQRDPFGATLASAVESAYVSHTVVRIASVTTFQWDRFWAFKPNTSPDTINAALGFTWAKDYSDQTDTYCLFVFTSGSRVSYHLLFPRYQGDCKTLTRVGPYTRAQGVFSITSAGPTTGGQPFLQLHPTA